MRTPHGWIITVAMIALAACTGRTSLNGDSDATTDASTEPIIDAVTDTSMDVLDAPVDTSIPDLPDDAECFMSYFWVTEPRTIDSVVLLDHAREWSTERLLVTAQLLSACETLAGVTVDIMPGDATDFIQLTAYAWVPVGLDCPPSAPLVDRVVTIPGREQGNFMVNVSDATSPGGGLRLSYDRERCDDSRDDVYPDAVEESCYDGLDREPVSATRGNAGRIRDFAHHSGVFRL